MCQNEADQLEIMKNEKEEKLKKIRVKMQE